MEITYENQKSFTRDLRRKGDDVVIAEIQSLKRLEIPVEFTYVNQ